MDERNKGLMKWVENMNEANVVNVRRGEIIHK
jgi:hypothetical protein